MWPVLCIAVAKCGKENYKSVALGVATGGEALIPTKNISDPVPPQNNLQRALPPQLLLAHVKIQ